MRFHWSLAGVSWWEGPNETFLGGGRLFLPGSRRSAGQCHSLRGGSVLEGSSQHHVWKVVFPSRNLTTYWWWFLVLVVLRFIIKIVKKKVYIFYLILQTELLFLQMVNKIYSTLIKLQSAFQKSSNSPIDTHSLTNEWLLPAQLNVIMFLCFPSVGPYFRSFSQQFCLQLAVWCLKSQS